MRYLPFERAFELESMPCIRCDESGVYSSPNQRATRECWNCRGLGRLITPRGRALFAEICAQLGHPVILRESRVQPKHLDMIFASAVREGMHVAPPYQLPRAAPQRVTKVEHVVSGSVRITLEDGSVLGLSGIDALRRELTAAELDQIDAFMALHVGAGALAYAAGSGRPTTPSRSAT
jgi:hypothetical protein